MTEFPIGILVQIRFELLNSPIELPLVIQRDRLLVVGESDAGGPGPKAHPDKHALNTRPLHLPIPPAQRPPIPTRRSEDVKKLAYWYRSSAAASRSSGGRSGHAAAASCRESRRKR